MFGLFDKADVTVNLPPVLNMEDQFDCQIDIMPKSDANLRKIEVEFFCQETAISRGSTDSYYYKKVFNDLRIPFNETKLKKGQPLTVREHFSLPKLSTPTILAANHRVQWFVRVRLDVPWWPDTRRENEIKVLPILNIRD